MTKKIIQLKKKYFLFPGTLTRFQLRYLQLDGSRHKYVLFKLTVQEERDLPLQVPINSWRRITDAQKLFIYIFFFKLHNTLNPLSSWIINIMWEPQSFKKNVSNFYLIIFTTKNRIMHKRRATYFWKKKKNPNFDFFLIFSKRNVTFSRKIKSLMMLVVFDTNLWIKEVVAWWIQDTTNGDCNRLLS